MLLRRILMVPHLVRWGVRAPRGTEQDRWDRYWAGVGGTGDGGDVLWDSSDPAEPERYLEVLDRFADRDLPVVDLGCGNGRFTRALGQRGRRVVGLDVSDAAVALAREEAAEDPGDARPSFLVADIAVPGAGSTLRGELGEAHVFVRGVLHVLTAEARQHLAENVRHLTGERGVVVIAETNHPGSLLSYLESLGAGARGLPHPVARVIAAGLPAPRPFGADELEQAFPDEAWERLYVDDGAVIHAVPMHRRSERPERIHGFVAVLRRRTPVPEEHPVIPEPRRATGDTSETVRGPAHGE